MLSAIPFRADGMLYLILFGEQEKHARPEAPNTVFLHISNITVAELQHSMARGIAHLGFGHGSGYVRDTPRGPQIEYLRCNSPGDSNCLATIADAIGQHLLLDHDEKRIVSDHLSKVIGSLIKHVRMDFDPLNPIKHLCNKEQTYIEFSMLLNAALCTRLAESGLDGSCEGGNCCDFPIHCFSTTTAFAMWLKEWTVNDGHILTDDQIVFGSGKDWIAPGWTILPDLPSQTTRAEGEANDLGTKKRRLDEQLLSTSFYDAGN